MENLFIHGAVQNKLRLTQLNARSLVVMDVGEVSHSNTWEGPPATGAIEATCAVASHPKYVGGASLPRYAIT